MQPPGGYHLGMFDQPTPDGVDPEQYHEAVDKIEEAMRKVGLYMNGVMVAKDPAGQDVMFMTFNVGDVAFSERIQSPEQDKFNDEIRGIESDFAQQEKKDLHSELKDDLEDLDGEY